MKAKRLAILAFSLLAAPAFADAPPAGYAAPPNSVTTTPAAPAVTPRPLPTPNDVKALAAAAQYRDALDALNRLLNSTAAPAPLYDRHEMLLLRIECTLQLKQNAAAVAMLEGLHDAAEKAGDLDKEAAAGSLALLIKKSTNGHYTPKLGDDLTPIDILPIANRPKAYTLLFADESASLQKRCDAADAATSLNPILNLLPAMENIRCLEHLTAGTTSKTDSLTAALLAAAAKNIDATLSPFDEKISAISTDAARLVPDNDSRTYRRPAVVAAHSHRAGLTAAEAQTLNAILAACQRLTKNISTLTHAFPGENALAPSADKTTTMQKRAAAVLDGEDDPGSGPPNGRLNRRQ